MKKSFKAFCKCKEASGLGWDESSSTILGSPTVWVAHIKRHSDWGPFQYKGFSNYVEMQEIFANTFATGAYEKSSTQVPLSSSDLESMEPDHCYLNPTQPELGDLSSSRKKRSRAEYSDIQEPSHKRVRENELYFDMMETIVETGAAIQAAKKKKLQILESAEELTPSG